jgi:hypothetical protein
MARSLDLNSIVHYTGCTPAASDAQLNEYSRIIAKKELLLKFVFPKSFVELSGLSGLLMLGYVY